MNRTRSNHDSSFDISHKDYDTFKSSESYFDISQWIGHLQIIWLVYQYFSRNRTQSNNLTCLLIFLLWKDGMTRLTPMPCALYRCYVNNYCVILSSHGTDVKNSWLKFSFRRYRIYTSTWPYSNNRVLCCEAVQHKWCRYIWHGKCDLILQM